MAASLALLGALLTAIVTGLAATLLFELSLLEGLLLGSIVASTDAAAIFALLRGSHLRARLTQILEGEAGSNDPVASLTAGGLAYGAADAPGGSGFLAIYLAGLALSAATIPAKRTIVAFHGGLAWTQEGAR